MIMFFVLIGIFILGDGHAWAQDQQSRLAGDVVSVMKQSLKLTEEQAREVQPVIEEELKQIQLIKSAKMDPATQARRLVEVQEEQESQLRNYLTDDQLTQWKNLMSQVPQRKEKQLDKALDKVRTSPDAEKRPSAHDGVLSGQDDGILQSGPSNSIKSGVY